MSNRDKKEGFIVQAGILAFAGIIVRIIGILYNSPLTAIIGDEGNGYYNNAYNIYTIVLLISSYSIPSAVAKVIAQKLVIKEYRNAHRIFICALIYVLVIGGIASLFVFFFAGYLVEMENSVAALRVLAPTIFVYGLLGVLRGYFQAHKTMMQTSVSQILEQLINAIFSIGMAYAFVHMVENESETTRAIYGAVGGAVGTGAGVLVALLFMWGVYGMNRKTFQRRIEKDKTQDIDSYGDIIKMIFMVITPFILSTFVYNATTVINQTLYNAIMLNRMEISEAETASMYSALVKASKISNIPIALATAVSAAVLPGIAGDFSQGKLKDSRKKVTQAMRMTMLVSIPAAAGIGVLAKPILWVLFPQQETIELATGLLMIMASSVIFFAMSTLSNTVLQGIGKLNAPVINAVVSLIIQTTVVYLLMTYTDLGLYSLAIATVLYSFLMCIFNGIVVRKHLKYKQEWDKTFLRPTVAAVIMGGVAYGVYQGIYYLCHINVLALAAAICIAAAVYFILIIKWRAISETELKSMPKGDAIIRIAKKTGVMKTEVRKRKGKGKKSKNYEKTTVITTHVTTNKTTDKKRSPEENKINEDEYWLDE